MRQEKSLYVMAREPYKALFPGASMHHMVPVSRQGMDSEFNLFPWTGSAHTAWHRLFCTMTVREVWPLLPDIHLQLFQSESHSMVRDWCHHCLAGCGSARRLGLLSPQKVAALRGDWVACFGDAGLKSAQNIFRAMMLFMVFGRYAAGPLATYTNLQFRTIAREVENSSERSWAFRQVFQCLPARAHPRLLRKIVQQMQEDVVRTPTL